MFGVAIWQHVLGPAGCAFLAGGSPHELAYQCSMLDRVCSISDDI